ncbi:hypothetical protein BJ875DRAFT_390960 [Amylocarpus encephaloides]|uniref:Arf-GAP domain-containing protein n=1 Tax=Amylocarpus encephaloides TaxID=45428 RepID=A0A9P8CBX5_9HELO|nr:hypothetical protein BJ875DRAFT_390960 [Amylocarpus encephaloides]
MATALSKRQQARNERSLQDLIKSVPGNNICADCQARNPGWASWSLGIFLCMRCAALHRKLGTHITKVKSLSMDSWSTEQVENMKRVGNVASNRIYNPQNTRPPIPFDADEADSAIERFIRQKYMDGTVKSPVRHDTGSSGRSDEPPPLPPKTGSRFGFRSASSIFPLSSKSKREAAAAARQDFDNRRRSPSPPPKNNPSRVFGAPVSRDSPDDLESKLVKLRDMGFRDEKRNVAVLKGLSGNLEKSIETLVRLGEGQAPTPVPKNDSSGPSSRSRTPISPTAGITFERTRGKSPPKANSNNPFDMLDAPPPPVKTQSSQSTGSVQPQSPLSGNNPYQQFNNPNPFGLMPSQSQVNLNQSFQNMAISNTQPLFPNHTGGFPGPQPTQQQQLYQQSMTPPVPSVPQQYYPPIIYENPGQQPPQNTSYNPFLQQQTTQVQQPLQVRAPPINTSFQSNPFLQQSLGGNQSVYSSSPVEQSPSQYRQPAFHSHQNQQQQVQSNPFLQGNQQPQVQQQQQGQPPQNYPIQQQQYYQQFPQQTHSVLPQQTLGADKRSILDLYNYPQLAPTPQTPAPQPQQDPKQAQNTQAVPQNPPYQQQLQPASISIPASGQVPGSNNPFMAAGGGVVQSPGGGDNVGNLVSFAPTSTPNGPRHASHESVSIDAGGWQNGRHSPDVWGTISARSVR